MRDAERCIAASPHTAASSQRQVSHVPTSGATRLDSTVEGLQTSYSSTRDAQKSETGVSKDSGVDGPIARMMLAIAHPAADCLSIPKIRGVTR
ncbi:unnamed protein product [Diplocarpon coronariae]|nr:hypothetical protein JHW43_008840 [Diplocarpon mali]